MVGNSHRHISGKDDRLFSFIVIDFVFSKTINDGAPLSEVPFSSRVADFRIRKRKRTSGFTYVCGDWPPHVAFGRR